jgi:hypothetical protein
VGFSFSKCKSKSNACVRTATDEAAVRALFIADEEDEEEEEEEEDDEEGDGFIFVETSDCDSIQTFLLEQELMEFKSSWGDVATVSCFELLYVLCHYV